MVTAESAIADAPARTSSPRPPPSWCEATNEPRLRRASPSATSSPSAPSDLTRDSLVRYAGAPATSTPSTTATTSPPSVGLPGVLAHGMLTMGLAVQPVVDWAGDPAPRRRLPGAVHPPGRRRPRRGGRRRRRREGRAAGCGRRSARIDLTVTLRRRDRARQGPGARRASPSDAMTLRRRPRRPPCAAHRPARRRRAGPLVEPRPATSWSRRRSRSGPRATTGCCSAAAPTRRRRRGLRRHRHPRRDPRHRAARPAPDGPGAPARAGGRAVGCAGRATRSSTAGRASRRCPASPDRPAPRPSRTSAPTGRSSSTLVGVEFLDDATGEVRAPRRDELGLGYRTSVLKHGTRGVVLAVDLELADGSARRTRRPAERSRRLRAARGRARRRARRARPARRGCAARCSSSAHPRAWCSIRTTRTRSAPARSSPTRSCRENFARTLPADAPRWPVTRPSRTPCSGSRSGRRRTRRTSRSLAGGPYAVKLSAAWLIEQCRHPPRVRAAGFARGISQQAHARDHEPRRRDRGGGRAARAYIQPRVQSEFGVLLQPEPVLVGLTL